jgi:hypothetical protein
MFTDVSEVLAACIIRAMMEAASISETSVNFYQTIRRNNPEDSHLHTRRRPGTDLKIFLRLQFNVFSTPGYNLLKCNF